MKVFNKKIDFLADTYAAYDGYENTCIFCPTGYTTPLTYGGISPDNCTGEILEDALPLQFRNRARTKCQSCRFIFQLGT